MKAGFVMKKMLLLLLFLCTLLSAVSCADISQNKTTFLYAVGLDRDAAFYTVHALFGEDGIETSGESGGNSDSAKGGEKDSGEPSFTLTSFGGKTVRDAMDKFIASAGELYSGTCLVYLAGNALTEEEIDAFQLYLLDTPSLPLKRHMKRVEDVYTVLSENTSLSVEELEKQYETGGSILEIGDPTKQKTGEVIAS